MDLLKEQEGAYSVRCIRWRETAPMVAGHRGIPPPLGSVHINTSFRRDWEPVDDQGELLPPFEMVWARIARLRRIERELNSKVAAWPVVLHSFTMILSRPITGRSLVRPPRRSPAPRYGEAVLTVGDLRDWHRLSVECSDGRCRHAALLDARWLRQRRPAGEPLAMAARRCRCTACGRRGMPWWSVVAVGRDGDPD